MKTIHLHPSLIRQCQELFFRQSFLNDFSTCGMMGMYRYVLNLTEDIPFFAAILGTAGHACIFDIHEHRTFNHTYLDLMQRFETHFNTELQKLSTLPNINKQFSSISDQLQAALPTYVSYLQNYQAHPKNRAFLSTMHEQSFVLSIQDESTPDSPPYLFTGQIDQFGYYDDGTPTLRDIKFRDNSFRPSQTELDLNIQMTIYAAAIKYGQPACPACKPYYVQLPSLIPGSAALSTLHYDGPCSTCAAKLNTPYWPNMFPEKCELIWMKDFLRLEEDEYAKFVIDNTLPKIPNPKGKGPAVFPRVLNPKWADGKKAGDMKGPCFLLTRRTPTSLEVLMSDILGTCSSIRQGHFHRKPGTHCNFWCKYREQCQKGIELQVQEADLSLVNSFGTEDPF